MAIKKHKLDVAMEEDFCLLGVVADEPDYRLCWMINQALDFAFEKLDDIILFHRKLKVEQHFSLYAYVDEDALVTYRIIKNRSENGFYIDEIKNLDYLVHIHGEIIAEKSSAFMQAIGTISVVRMCVPVELKMIRNKERLMLW